MVPVRPTTFQFVQQLFEKASQLPEAEQRRYVEAHCGSDPRISEEVLGMLDQDRRGSMLFDERLESVASDLFDVSSEQFTAGRTFGPYRLRNVLGEGGMGVVYLAEREDLDSFVAVKFLRDAWLSPARQERFAVERRTLAQLNHPSIARLYDAGRLDSGTPWFAMEYVEGVPITSYCRAHHSSLNERLKIFRDVCEAVQYAHEHAVIHRDLKPSNILVKPGPQVRLLDFGIAKQLDLGGADQDRTRTELRMMTPAYAAPEQMRGEAVGLYTDVYALGVILYELLSGKTPARYSEVQLDAGNPAEPPSSVAKRTPEMVEALGTCSSSNWADLDVLCLTAIHKDAARRYRSVAALMRDVDHFLKGEPLEARPDDFRYKVAKFLQRNRRPVIAFTLMFVALIAIITFFTMHLARARSAAESASARSERVQQFMLSLFAGGGKESAPAEDLRVTALIDRGAKEAEALKSDPEVQAELFETLGGLYQKMGNLRQADRFLQAALEARRAQSPNGSAATRDLAGISLLRTDQARLPEAENLARASLDQAARSRSADPNALALANVALAKALEARGQHQQAIQLWERAVKLDEQSGSDPVRLASDLKSLADSNYYAGRYDEAQSLTERSLTLHRALFGPQHPTVAEDFINLGAIRSERGYFPDAEQFFRQALAAQEAWFGKGSPNTTSAMTQLGDSLVSQKRFDEAAPLLESALEIRLRTFGPRHPTVGTALNELAVLADQRDQVDRAIILYRQAADVYGSVYGERHYKFAVALANLGSVYLNKKDYTDAEQTFRRVIDIESQALLPTHNYLGVAQIKLGRSLLGQKRYAEAEQHTLAGYQICSKDANPAVHWLQSARKDLAEIYDGLGQPHKAAAMRAERAHFETPPAIRKRRLLGIDAQQRESHQDEPRLQRSGLKAASRHVSPQGLQLQSAFELWWLWHSVYPSSTVLPITSE